MSKGNTGYSVAGTLLAAAALLAGCASGAAGEPAPDVQLSRFGSADELLAAVNKALDRAGFAIVTSGMRQCLSDPEGVRPEDQQAMEKLFLSLA